MGRRLAMIGTGFHVWEIVEVAKDNDGLMPGWLCCGETFAVLVKHVEERT